MELVGAGDVDAGLLVVGAVGALCPGVRVDWGRHPGWRAPPGPGVPPWFRDIGLGAPKPIEPVSRSVAVRGADGQRRM